MCSPKRNPALAGFLFVRIKNGYLACFQTARPNRVSPPRTLFLQDSHRSPLHGTGVSSRRPIRANDIEIASRRFSTQNQSMERVYYVYLLASQRNGTLYCGVTNDIERRVHDHRTKARSSFSARYNVLMLVWYETYADISAAIAREKQIKHWNRAWKLVLIEAMNPTWRDLYAELNS
jgi:putative endonuclease